MDTLQIAQQREDTEPRVVGAPAGALTAHQGQKGDQVHGIHGRAAGRRDFAIAVGAGVVLAAISWFLAAPVAPAELLPAILVLAGGMGVLGYLDHVTRLIRNRHVAALALAISLTLVYAETAAPEPILLPALAGGAVIFVMMLVFALVMGMGGGDIKVSVLPGAVLTAVNPLAAALWLWLSLTIGISNTLIDRVIAGRQASASSAMGPAMAVAAVVAVPLAGWLTTLGAPLGVW